MGKTMIICGDALTELRKLPDESVHCCVTSPPYWGLRDYGTEGQLGLEKTPEEYVAHLVEVFKEVRRVLRKDGTLWLNLGDSYAGNCSRVSSGRAGYGEEREGVYNKVGDGLKPKDLVGIPWRVAFALQQPYEHHVLNAATDRAWMAAMIDAEGCIAIPECKSSHGSGSSYPPIVQIRMCDTEALDRCVELVGKGGNMGEQLPPSYAEANQRPAYQWRINGRIAADVLADAYPYLLIKRRQACVAWTLQKIRDGYETKKGVSIPTDALAKQVLCREIMKKLNQRESVDLPSWIEEPKTIIEPGWYLRQDLIWAKPNPMPESVTDRCTKSHEYIFLLAKSQKYYYDAEAIAENSVGERPISRMVAHAGLKQAQLQSLARTTLGTPADGHRNRRSVWTITTKPFKEAHFATFPPDLVEPMIKAGTSEKGCCPKCGAPWERVIERTSTGKRYSVGKSKEKNKAGLVTGFSGYDDGSSCPTFKTVAWQPTCSHNLDPISCAVLDPFFGAGTTGLVAKQLGREFIGIELNPKYCEMAERRIAQTNYQPGLEMENP